MDAVNRRRNELGEDWLVIFCSDHGGTSAGSHGGLSLNELKVPLIIQGRQVPSGDIQPTPLNTDIVPTVLAHLGIEVPSSWGIEGQTVGFIPKLSIKAENAGLTLRWPGIATLESSVSMEKWKVLPQARSPHRHRPSGDQSFYRLTMP
jgi:arylsulfatase A-like enzyme